MDFVDNYSIIVAASCK